MLNLKELYKDKNVVSLIPARGGSKGIPKKNIKKMLGKPLIAHTIKSSLGAKLIDRTLVSSDDPNIIKIAKDYDAEVPFVRPSNLAGDDILDFPVIKHAISYLIEEENYKPDILVYLRPTMPTRTSEEIDEAISLLVQNDEADSVRTTRFAPYPPHWMKRINSSGFLEPYNQHVKPYVYTRRQDLPEVVICDGYVDAAKVKAILKENNFPPGNKLALFKSDTPFIDIDTQDEWEICEYYMRKRDK